MKEKIIETLGKVRPMLQRDGGDVEFVSFDEQKGIVNVRLRGACGCCSGAQMTLKMVIEKILKEEVPGVKEVVGV
jgi:Fe-S cluster biogenesis protein NfuA